jgi:hypothetical protein
MNQGLKGQGSLDATLKGRAQVVDGWQWKKWSDGMEQNTELAALIM